MLKFADMIQAYTAYDETYKVLVTRAKSEKSCEPYDVGMLTTKDWLIYIKQNNIEWEVISSSEYPQFGTLHIVVTESATLPNIYKSGYDVNKVIAEGYHANYDLSLLD